VIDFYYWPTPNGWKVAIMLEECGLEYRVIPVNIGRGDQFKPEFLAISPNNRMPAIVDHDSEGGPLPVFESGAILIHLAERTARFMPQSNRGRKECLEWLFWQVGNLGPMAGQLSHFVNYAQGEHPYSHKRYADEYNRCLGVLERYGDRRYSELALGIDRQAAPPAARRVPQCRALARGGQTAPCGTEGGRSRQGGAPLGAADRGRTARPL